MDVNQHSFTEIHFVCFSHFMPQMLLLAITRRVVTLILAGDHLTATFQHGMPRPFPTAGYQIVLSHF